MEYLEMFFELDFVSIILAIVTILLAWQFLDKLLVWFWEKTGIEFRHIRKRREEHELIMKTAENLSRLQEQHQEDVERVTQNDRKMQQEFSEFVEELKKEGITEIHYIGNLEKKLDFIPGYAAAPWMISGMGILYGRK